MTLCPISGTPLERRLDSADVLDTFETGGDFQNIELYTGTDYEQFEKHVYMFTMRIVF